MSALWGKAESWYFEVSLEHDKLSQIPYFHLNIFKKENKAKPARERVFTAAIAFLVTLNRLEKQEMFLLLNHRLYLLVNQWSIRGIKDFRMCFSNKIIHMRAATVALLYHVTESVKIHQMIQLFGKWLCFTRWLDESPNDSVMRQVIFWLTNYLMSCQMIERWFYDLQNDCMICQMIRQLTLWFMKCLDESPNDSPICQMTLWFTKWLDGSPNDSVMHQMILWFTKWLDVSPNDSTISQMTLWFTKWLDESPNDSTKCQMTC